MNKRNLVIVGLTSSFLVTAASVMALDPQLRQSMPQHLIVALTPTQIDRNVPQRISPCLPTINLKRVELQSSAKDERSNTYYLLRVTGVSNQYGEPLIKVNTKNECTTLIPHDVISPLSQHISVGLARTLAMGALRDEIQQAGGKEKYQRQLMELASGEDGGLYYPPEYIWAFQQLGIQLPKNTMILQKSTKSTQWNE